MRSQAAPKIETPADPIQVEVRPLKERVLGGEPVVVIVVLRNSSDKPIPFLMLGPHYEFVVRNNFNLKRGKGRLVALSGRGRDLSTVDKVAERIVRPNEEWQYRVVLSRLFDMSRAGTYTISGSKKLKIENPVPGGNLIGANKVARDIKITVAEDDLAP